MTKEISNRRNEDVSQSELVSSFLDKYFYPTLNGFQRIDNPNLQYAGIDVVFAVNNKFYQCDEKAAIRYINKDLQTFSLELSFINRSLKLMDGWLLSDKELNNSFLFVWITKAKNDLLTSIDDIEEMDVALVDKHSIINHLNKIGLSKKHLYRKINLIRQYNNVGKQPPIEESGCKFYYSKFLAEKPINILLKKETLIELSDLSRKIKVNDDSK